MISVTSDIIGLYLVAGISGAVAIAGIIISCREAVCRVVLLEVEQATCTKGIMTMWKDFQQPRMKVNYGSEDIRPTLLKDFPTALNDSML